MWEDPAELIDKLLERDPLPKSLELHASLFRLCRHHLATLYNHLREPEWVEYACEIELKARQILDSSGNEQIRGLGELLQHPAEENLLVRAAAVLQALDAYHGERRGPINHAIVSLSLPQLECQTAFLWPPANPIAEHVPEDLRLNVGEADLSRDLRGFLGLKWQLVTLETHANQPCFHELEARVGEDLADRLASRGDLSVGLASPFAELGYQIQGDPARRHDKRGVPYHFVRLEPSHLPKAREALDQILQNCSERQIDILCFPELTLDTDLLRHLQTKLATQNTTRHPALVLSGSFHLSQTDGWVNRSALLDSQGRILREQDKCVAFPLKPKEAAAMDDAFRDLLGIDEGGGYEDIDVSAELNVIDSPIGRLSTPICLDFCGSELRELLVACQVNLLLVPAMTPGMGRFPRRAREFGDRNRATTFAVNSSWLMRQLDKELADENLFVAYVPTKSKAVQPPERTSDDLRTYSIRVLLGGQ